MLHCILPSLTVEHCLGKPGCAHFSQRLIAMRGLCKENLVINYDNYGIKSLSPCMCYSLLFILDSWKDAQACSVAQIRGSLSTMASPHPPTPALQSPGLLHDSLINPRNVLWSRRIRNTRGQSFNLTRALVSPRSINPFAVFIEVNYLA